MDWIDPRYAATTESKPSKSKSSRAAGEKRSSSSSSGSKSNKSRRGARKPLGGKRLERQVSAALAQPLPVWVAAYDHALAGLHWPERCTLEGTFLFSTLMQEQAEILVRAGMSASKLADIVAESVADNEETRASQLADVVGLMEQSLESQAFLWLDTADVYAKSALGVTALAWHLPDQARRAGNEWLKQWLESVIARMATYTADPEESVLCHLVMQSELPLLIGLATSVSQRTALESATVAMDNLAEHLERGLDQPGPWLAHGATYLRAALASVLRCRTLADTLGIRKFYPPQRKALDVLLQHAARWARNDGTQLLAAGWGAARAKPYWHALCLHSKYSNKLQAAMQHSGLPGPAPNRLSKSKSGKRILPAGSNAATVSLPEPTFYSADAAGVCMQSDWCKRGSRLAIDFSDSDICLEVIGPKGVPLLAGEWTANVELENQAQLQLDEWAEVCWFTDDDVDYLELEARFGPHARVQRQAVLLREDRLLILADALLCDRAGAWSLGSCLPLAADTRLEAARKTTEGFMVGPGGARCLTLPLHLPEWRQQVLSGGLEIQDETLLVHQQTQAARTYVATVFSLCNSHAKKPFTWRRLTVGEDLRIVGPEEAVAYRLQIGKQQWVVYRSLAESKRRTAIGLHTLSDFFVGRLDPTDGEIDPLLMVETTV